MIKTSAFLMLFAACSVGCSMVATCGHKVACNSNWGMEMSTTVKAKICPEQNCSANHTELPRDCADHFEMGHEESGIYEIWPMSREMEGKSIKVYCDMTTDGGGWTVIQRRGDFKEPIDYFFKDWKSYKEGFGDKSKEFWLGNDNIFALTNQKLYSARFDLEDVEHNKRYAHYRKFWIDDKSNYYTLHITDYSGNAGDSMNVHNDRAFSTKDQDHDTSEGENCADTYKGGWWYSDCHFANLNGLNLQGKHDIYAIGIDWFHWKGYKDSLHWTEIKIRPSIFHTIRDITGK